MRRQLFLAVIGLLMLISLGCSITGLNIETTEVGDLRREESSVSRDGAESVRVDLRMGAGEMKINAGDDVSLMDAEFIYNVAEWEPNVTYTVTDGQGRLDVRQPSTDKMTMRTDIRYEWRLTFSDQVPMDMRIECGAGSHDIDLSGLQLTQLDLKLGAGDVKIDLSDNPDLDMVDIDLGAGDVEVDLSGPWLDGADIDIQGGVGKVTVLLPNDIGVKVNVTKGIGDIDSSGLYLRDGDYVNAAWDDAAVRIEVNVQAGVGRVVLDVQE